MEPHKVDDKIDLLDNIGPEARTIKRKKLELHYELLVRANEKAKRHGRLIQQEDIASEVKVIKPIITRDMIKKALSDGQEYLANRFSPNSAWDCAMLISTLLDIGEDPNSPVIKRTRILLLSKKILTNTGLESWGHPDDNTPNIFDTSFAAIALIKLGIKSGSKEDQSIIKNAIDFVKSSRDYYGGWQPKPGREEIDVGATSWALVALLTYGLSKTDEDVARGVKWLKDNQHDDGGWGDHYKSKNFKKSYVGRTYDATTALLMANEAESENLQRAKRWLIEQHKLLRKTGEIKTWVWGWEGYKTEDITENDLENTILAVITLLKLKLNVDSDLIVSGINTILERRNEASLWGSNTPRAVLCLNEFCKSDSI
jgi:uncharacterized protein (UPF0147 family)